MNENLKDAIEEIEEWVHLEGDMGRRVENIVKNIIKSKVILNEWTGAEIRTTINGLFGPEENPIGQSFDLDLKNRWKQNWKEATAR